MGEGTIGWAAGIMDGEGCVGAYFKKANNGRRRGYIAPLIKISNADPRMAEMFLKIFRLGYLSQNRRDKRSSKWKRMFTWGVDGATGVSQVLRLMLPHLVLKREQAVVALKFCETMHYGKPITPAIDRRRERLAKRLKELKKL